MIKLQEARKLERLLARLEAAHEEISKLALTPDVQMTAFKRDVVGGLMDEVATFLGERFPLRDRDWLRGDKATYSDAVLALSQCVSVMASLRFDNAVYRNEKWYWELESAKEGVPETPYVPLGRPKTD